MQVQRLAEVPKADREDVLLPTLGVAQMYLVAGEVEVGNLQQAQILASKAEATEQEDRHLVAEVVLTRDEPDERAGGDALSTRAPLLSAALLDLPHRVRADAKGILSRKEEFVPREKINHDRLTGPGCSSAVFW